MAISLKWAGNTARLFSFTFLVNSLFYFLRYYFIFLSLQISNTPTSAWWYLYLVIFQENRCLQRSSIYCFPPRQPFHVDPIPSHLLKDFTPAIFPPCTFYWIIPMTCKRIFTWLIFKNANKQAPVPFQLLPHFSVPFPKQTLLLELSILVVTLLISLNFSINCFNQALVLTILSRSPMSYILSKPTFVLSFLLVSYWTQQHLILLNALSCMKQFLLELPGLPIPLIFLLNQLCFPSNLSFSLLCFIYILSLSVFT